MAVLREFPIDARAMMRRMRWLIAILLCACSDGAAPHADAPTTHPDVNVAACGAIGMACTTTCPNNLECISSNVCAPVRGSCGGFAGAMCQDTSLTCVYPTGSSAGHCMRSDEKECLCAIAPNAAADCMQP